MTRKDIDRLFELYNLEDENGLLELLEIDSNNAEEVDRAEEILTRKIEESGKEDYTYFLDNGLIDGDIDQKAFCISIVGFFKDKQRLIEYIEEHSEISIEDKIELVRATGDEKYIMDFINNNKELDIHKMIYILIRLENGIQKYIDEHPEIPIEDKIELVLESGDKEHIMEIFQSSSKASIERKSKIILPPGLTIGIEIESENPVHTYCGSLDIYPKGWKAKGDGSLHDGTEVVSPVLESSNTNQVVEDIYTVCEILQFLGQRASERCGGHVHIGADYLIEGGPEAIADFVNIYLSVEDLLYIIGNAEGELPREGAKRYAAPLLKLVEEISKDGSIEVHDLAEIEEKRKQLQIKGGRYRALNLGNVGKQGKNTIEFRGSNGTVNPDTWIENINLYGGLVAAGREMPEIREKVNKGVASAEEQLRYEAFLALQDTEISDKERLEALLSLVFKEEEQKDIYRKRYEVNKELKIKREQEEKIIRGETVFPPEEIAEDVLKESGPQPPKQPKFVYKEKGDEQEC